MREGDLRDDLGVVLHHDVLELKRITIGIHVGDPVVHPPIGQDSRVV